MSRIISGVAGGHPLTSVATDATRPTTDRVKEALFSRLESWDVLRDAVVLDLFAGSGALGLEAVSRGATSARLVDQAEAAQVALRKNVTMVNKALGRSAAAAVRASALSFLASYRGELITLAFLDPPYPIGEEELAKVLAALAPSLHEDAVIVVERGSRSPAPTWPQGWHQLRERRYGESTLWFAETLEFDADEDGGGVGAGGA
jgi:16S rRNA (guanine966-N2)-methyltransferase